MTISKEVQDLVGRVKLTGWIALLATLVLLIELNLIVSNAWEDFDFQTQMIIFIATLVVVLTFGFTRIGPKGLLGKRRKK
jgi:L-asparagine transporter-like permease